LLLSDVDAPLDDPGRQAKIDVAGDYPVQIVWLAATYGDGN